jgi:hypothetical protein
MPIDASIYSNLKAPETPDMMANYTRMMQLKNMLQQGQMQQQQGQQQQQIGQQTIQENDLKLQQMKQDMADQETARKIFADSGGDPAKAQAPLVQALGAKAIPLLKTITDHQQALANLDKTQREAVQSKLKTFSDTIDEIASLPPEQRNAAYQAKIVQSGAIDKAKAAELPPQWDDQLMSMYGNHLKQTMNDLEVEAKQSAAKEAELKATAQERTMPNAEGLTPAQVAQNRIQEGNVTEAELALKEAKGDIASGKARRLLVQGRIQEALAKVEAGTTTPDQAAVDISSQSILAQTGLSLNAFRALTGQTSQLGRDQKTRNRANAEAQQWANKNGIDISTMPAQYAAYNKVLASNIERMSYTKIMQNEIQGTIQNLQGVVNDKDLGKLRIENVLKIWAGQEVNDNLAQQYAMHLNQLRTELTAYNAATQGRSGNQIDVRDRQDADQVIKNGIASGSLTGLSKAVENSTGKMNSVMQNSVNAANRAVWNLFGVGANFKNKSTGQKQAGSDKDLSNVSTEELFQRLSGAKK